MPKMRTTIQISTTEDFIPGTIIKDEIVEEKDDVPETKAEQLLGDEYSGIQLFTRSMRDHDITKESKWSDIRSFKVRKPWGVFRNSKDGFKFMDENSWQACDVNGNIVSDKSVNRNHSYYQSIKDIYHVETDSSGQKVGNWFVHFPPLWVKFLPNGIAGSDSEGCETFILSDYKHDDTFQPHPVFLYLDWAGESKGTEGLLISKYNAGVKPVSLKCVSDPSVDPYLFESKDISITHPIINKYGDRGWFYNHAQVPVERLNDSMGYSKTLQRYIPFERWHLAFLQLLLLAKYCHFDPQGEYMKEYSDRPYDVFGLVDINKPGENLFVDGTWCTANYIIGRPNRSFSKFGHSNVSKHYLWVSSFNGIYPEGDFFWDSSIYCSTNTKYLEKYKPDGDNSVLSWTKFNTWTANFWTQHSYNSSPKQIQKYHMMSSFLHPHRSDNNLYVSNKPMDLFLYQTQRSGVDTVNSAADSHWYFTNWPIEFTHEGKTYKHPGGLFSTAYIQSHSYIFIPSGQKESMISRFRFCKTLHLY